ncbi:MAG: GIY-YIG nuclease family protein [Chloroflexota bacterium]|nr:GIY-YIG nuclease family protein [Chloroflexota bacterium]
MTTHDYRIQKADELSGARYFFSYVLELEDGTFYVGSTNAPYARWTEHAVSKGAKETQNRQFKVRMVLPFLTRREAEYNEKRLQSALAGGTQHIEALLSVFDQMVNVVRPQKTFSELRREEQEYEAEMQRVFHFSTQPTFSPSGFPFKPTACGYPGPRHYATPNWEVLKKMARDEAFTGNIYHRQVCRRCLVHAPVDE